MNLALHPISAVTRVLQTQYLLHSNFCSSDPSNYDHQHVSLQMFTNTAPSIAANTCTYLKVHLHNVLKTF
jgi:hypothetical protein